MRKLALLLVCVLIFPICFSFASCKKDKMLTLNVYNWEEYIADDVVSDFEKDYYKRTGTKVKVNYSTFGTCENMYNELKLTQNKKTKNFKYDLVCPSDYMIQRMIEEDMCEKFDWTKIPNYVQYTSPYILNLFSAEQEPATTNTPYKLGDYSACYMWGTMGYVYNPDPVNAKDMQSWSGILNPAYRNKSTIKDSPRDSYILAMGIAYENELNGYKTTYPNYLDSTHTDFNLYNKSINDLFNKVDKTTLDKTQEILKKVKSNLYGFEVDSGKNDMATGKLWINFAWSGDGVYILDVAEESGTYLEYSVPTEGSNIFFDGWVMPKGANTDLAQDFLNYLFQPEIAVDNMNYIGYTPSTAGLSLFENAIDWYGTYVLQESSQTEYDKVQSAEEGSSDYDRYIVKLGSEYYEELYIGDIINKLTPNGDGIYTASEIIYPAYNDNDEIIGIDCTKENVKIYARDLSYFFGDDQEILDIYGATTIYTDTLNRQFTAQYPDLEVVNRCAIMKHLPNSQLEDLNEMWSGVKIGYMKPIYMVLIVLGFILLFSLAVVFFKLVESGKFGYGKVRKDMTLVSKEEIKN